jgi:hypothetical protein
MRLHEIQDTLIQYERGLQVAMDQGPTLDGRPAFSIKNLNSLRASLTHLRKVPPLEPVVTPMFQLAIVKDGRDEVLIPQNHEDTLRFTGSVHELVQQVSMLKALLESVTPPESETAMAVEIPTSNLAEVAKIISMLDAFFAEFIGLPVGDEDERFEAVELEGFDVGSTWLVLKTKSAAALKLVGWLVRGALSLADWARARAAEAKILEAVADDTVDAAKYAKTLRRHMARKVAEWVAGKAASKATSEEIGRLAVLLDRAEEVLDSRVRIVPSLRAAPAAREAFPPPEPPISEGAPRLAEEVRRKRMAVSKRKNEASKGVQRRGAPPNYFQTVVIRSQQNQRTSVDSREHAYPCPRCARDWDVPDERHRPDPVLRGVWGA